MTHIAILRELQLQLDDAEQTEALRRHARDAAWHSWYESKRAADLARRLLAEHAAQQGTLHG